ncbi:energy transducer TonB [Spirosoma validum]|uniref:TonB C-terminal domain-containing protein n=1 Tax=Spirosoma validum TaxID=2771355 RepID=A0A927GEE9_9BACT|nr:hypothetical protein [Spirosoma validum]MBD2754777.1 hypothetical protein [Spirosoma validum]
MKRFVLVLLCLGAIASLSSLFSCSSVFAQSLNEKVYTIAERQPEYPGGPTALSLYLAENIRIPNALLRKNFNTGPISAKFIVDNLGFVHDVRITTKPLDKKAQKRMQGYLTSIITAVEKMPRWQPGEVGGKPVAVFYTLPIEVNLQ